MTVEINGGELEGTLVRENKKTVVLSVIKGGVKKDIKVRKDKIIKIT